MSSIINIQAKLTTILDPEDEDACGYGNLYMQGASCGGCYEIKCRNDTQCCNAGNLSVTITVTNNCSPPDDDYYLFYDAHFNMSKPAFSQISSRRAGYVPVLYRRVPCKKQGGIQFTLNGNRQLNLVLVSNVAGEGEVSAMSVKGRQMGWISKKPLVGQSLSFKVTTSDGKQATTYNVVPSNWQFGQTFSGNQIY
ncbi:hypothetical protein O6H91_01G152200 [Diphasiastrum complanatum]|uniref:Uncharacterized protein n=1 Tax=Diphasiastrum complanatum TaxID=34168 RepID=A0ACC2EXC1_DIPCM|nr:hypothetical protein O6H91_01G152200 [Diphasiastrum complanatum]